MTSCELVIRLGRVFDVLIDDEFKRPPRLWAGEEDRFSKVTEIRVPFADRESAEAALREVTVSVRAVHDAGGEDYRPVVAGEVVRTAEDVKFAGDLARAGEAERARAEVPAPDPGPSRDMKRLERVTSMAEGDLDVQTPWQADRDRAVRTGKWPESWGPFHRHFANDAVHRDGHPECDQPGTPRRVYVFDPDALHEHELIVARYAIAHPDQFTADD